MQSELNFKGTCSGDWDRIYGDSPKEKLLLSKPVIYYIRAVDKIFETDKDQLLEYFPHIRLIDELNEFNGIRNILEVGCGSGIYSYVLFKYFGGRINIFLLDFSTNAILEAQKLFASKKNIFYIKANAFDLPFRDDFFDICITGGLIEHFELDEQKNMLDEISRVSKNQLHQYPISNVFYWTQRYVVSLFNKGKWPFGFEIPISKRREHQLFGDDVKKTYNSYLLKRLEFRAFTNRYYKTYLTLKQINRLNIYKLVYTDKLVYI